MTRPGDGGRCAASGDESRAIALRLRSSLRVFVALLFVLALRHRFASARVLVSLFAPESSSRSSLSSRRARFVAFESPTIPLRLESSSLSRSSLFALRLESSSRFVSSLSRLALRLGALLAQARRRLRLAGSCPWGQGFPREGAPPSPGPMGHPARCEGGAPFVTRVGGLSTVGVSRW